MNFRALELYLAVVELAAWVCEVAS
jgi:hypothetical protein